MPLKWSIFGGMKMENEWMTNQHENQTSTSGLVGIYIIVLSLKIISGLWVPIVNILILYFGDSSIPLVKQFFEILIAQSK